METDLKSIKTVIIGIGSVVILLLLLVLIFGNLSGNLGFSQTSSSVINETINLSSSGSTFAQVSGKSNPAVSSVVVRNATSGVIVLAGGNYTATSTTLTAVAESPFYDLNVNVSYTIAYDSDRLKDENNIIGNVTTGASNLSAKVPTALTLLGVILIVAVVFLVVRMFMGGRKGNLLSTN